MMKDPFGGMLLNTAFRILVPFSLIYAVYVLILGESSPGGGFQAGVVMGFGIILARLILGEDSGIFNIRLKNSLALAGCGTFIYTLADRFYFRKSEHFVHKSHHILCGLFCTVDPLYLISHLFIRV